MRAKESPANQFVVTTSLGVENFDQRRHAKARLRLVMAEVKRIRRSDGRIVRARLVPEPGVSSTWRLELTIGAPSGWMAFEVGSATVRAAIHASGGSTAGWERIEPRMDTGELIRGPRPGVLPSWHEVNAVAARRAAALPVLPPLSAAPPLAPTPALFAPMPASPSRRGLVSIDLR